MSRRSDAEVVAAFPSPYRERVWPIMGLNDELPNCAQVCLYGECGGGRTSLGCGGCCGCLGGCQVEYENQQTAPHVWEGDQG